VGEVEGAIRKLVARYPALLVVVKCGAEGAIAARGSERIQAAADPVEVVDTTGAGDAFNAGFLLEFVSQSSAAEGLLAALNSGAAAGAACVCTQGACEAPLTTAQLEAVVARRKAPPSDEAQEISRKRPLET